MLKRKLSQVVQLNSTLAQAMGTLEQRPLFWALYAIEKMKPLIVAFETAVKNHKDAEAVNTARQEGKTEVELAEQFADYADNIGDLLNQDVELNVKKFDAKWLEGATVTKPLLGALLAADMIDLDGLESVLYKA